MLFDEFCRWVASVFGSASDLGSGTHVDLLHGESIEIHMTCNPWGHGAKSFGWTMDLSFGDDPNV